MGKAKEIPLLVNVPEDARSRTDGDLLQEALTVMQPVASKMGKTYKLVDESDCHKVPHFGEEWDGKSNCQVMNWSAGENGARATYGTETDREINVALYPDAFDNTAHRHEGLLHETGHAFGLIHTKIKGDLMYVEKQNAGHGEGPVMKTNDINKLQALYARTNIAERLAEAEAA